MGVHVQMFPFYKHSSHIRLGTALVQHDLILTSHICENPIPCKVTFWEPSIRLQLTDSRGTQWFHNRIFEKTAFNIYIIDPSVQFSRSVVSDSLWPHESQHARPPCPSPTPGVYSNSCPLCQWCQITLSSSVIPFSSCRQSFPASKSFQMSQLFASGGQHIGVLASTSVLPLNIQDWSPLGWTGWVSLQSKGLSRVFSNTTVQKHQFFSTQLSL